MVVHGADFDTSTRNIVERIGLAHTVCAKARFDVGASEGVRSEDVFVEERDPECRMKYHSYSYMTEPTGCSERKVRC
jgi:hypothetical protein